MGIELEEIREYATSMKEAQAIQHSFGGRIEPLPEGDLFRRRDDAKYVVVYFLVKSHPAFEGQVRAVEHDKELSPPWRPGGSKS